MRHCVDTLATCSNVLVSLGRVSGLGVYFATWNYGTMPACNSMFDHSRDRTLACILSTHPFEAIHG